MRIECPSCFAAYVVPDSLLTAGRVVRCARCGGDWTPVATSSVPEAEVEVLPPEPPPEPPPTATAVDERGAEQVVVATRLSAMERLAAHAGMATVILHPPPIGLGSESCCCSPWRSAPPSAWRGEIVAAWPPSARAYALFGLQPQTETP